MMESSALVFDIKRFALHDGSGLRTTIFFKGCPLRCQWCQNPEGLLPDRQVIYFANQCMHCQRCDQVADDSQIRFENGRPYILKGRQKSFDRIIRACPTGAIRYDSQKYTIDELIEVIEADRVFYRDDGGVTFSGGEPLLQGDFLFMLVQACHNRKIHTAIETSMYGASSLVEKIIPYLDIIYIDLKLFDDHLHQKYTGVSNKIIKQHIQYVLKSEYKQKVIIRTPLIPHITATDENIKQISDFLVKTDPYVKYELLNYNPLASAKYELYNYTYGVDSHEKMFDSLQMEHFFDIVSQCGIKNIIKE